MTSFGSVLWAEIRKLHSRPLARLAGLVLLGVAVFGPLALSMLAHAGITWNEQDLGATLDLCGANGLRWGLVVRNFFTAHLLLAALASVSYAGELQAHTLREDLVRPVPRAQLLAAKWFALCTWSFVTLAAHAALGSVVGLLALGVSGQTAWGDVALGFLATWVAEVSVALVALAAAVVLRTVAGAFLALVLVLLFERVATWGGWALRGLLAMGGEPPKFFEVLAFTPSAGWSGWSELASGADPSWQPWVALAGWTVLAGLAAFATFQRTDVP